MNAAKRVVRESRQSRNPLVRGAAASLFAARESFRAVRSFTMNGTYRSTVLARLMRPGSVHQTTTLTVMNRYPEIFDACRTYFAERRDLRLLSFGCSTGEEVLSLRGSFPSAWITGADINTRSLAACRARSVDERIAFVYSTRRALVAHGVYDAIFCMAVFQRTPHAVEEVGLTSLKGIYPFEKFEQQVRELDALLEPGGLLVIHHAQYRLTDTSLGEHYLPLTAPGLPEDTGPIFDRNSALVPNATRDPSIFIKNALPVRHREGHVGAAAAARRSTPPAQVR